jgi:chlorobactene glucosyltransferase
VSGPVVVLTVVLAVMVLVAALNLLAAPRLHRVLPARVGPRVSVLIPARDEEDNLRRLLPALRTSPYPDLEILVLDDGSTDGTPAVIREHASADPRVTAMEGREPPAGWNGKNWACHQLSKRASGEVLLFCDADVYPAPEAVARTVAAMVDGGVDALTALPRHERGGWFEEAVVPLVTRVPIAALLPLPLVHWTRAVSLSVGNGQWFAWRREAYRLVGGHARVRSDALEDVRLARLAKAEGLRLMVHVATRDLSVRMYRDRPATWDGFARNLYLLAGGRLWTLALGVGLLLTAGLGPILLVPVPGVWPGILVPLLGLAAVRLLAGALMADTPRGILLHPVGVMAVAALAVASWQRHSSGTVAWKRRILTHERSV